MRRRRPCGLGSGPRADERPTATYALAESPEPLRDIHQHAPLAKRWALQPAHLSIDRRGSANMVSVNLIALPILRQHRVHVWIRRSAPERLWLRATLLFALMLRFSLVDFSIISGFLKFFWPSRYQKNGNIHHKKWCMSCGVVVVHHKKI